jgi:hypothetical protein
MMARVLGVSAVCLCGLAAACSQGSSRPQAVATPTTTIARAPTLAVVNSGEPEGPVPPAVPATAVRVVATTEFGQPSAAPDADPRTTPLFFSLSCQGGVLTLVTSTSVVYAELPCDRSLPASAIQPYLGKPLHVRLVMTSPAKLYMDSSQAGSVEFTVGRVWLVR